MVKKKHLILSILSLLLATLSFFAISFVFPNKTKAETFLSENNSAISSDLYYSLEFQGYTQNNSSISPAKLETVSVMDKTIQYFCYDWSKISNFRINIDRTATQNSDLQFMGIDLELSYMQTENLSQNIQDLKEEQYKNTTLYSTDADINIPTIRFYIDEQNGVEEGNQTKFGYGFGLYRFELVYRYIDKTASNTSVTTRNLTPLYFAILPDNIDNINGNISINKEIGFSTTFLNAYNFSIDNNLYDYVNPCYIEWFVEGVDEHNLNYVLTKSDRVDEFSSYAYIYDGEYPYGRNGTTFHFDSKGVEADFKITCNIYDSEGNLKTSATTNVSTIKVKNPSYLWLIIVCIIIGLVIISSIILIIVLKKKEKIY